MQVTREVAEIINSVVVLAKNRHYELVTPELVLYVICGNKIFAEAFEDCGGNISELSEQLEGAGQREKCRRTDAHYPCHV